LPRKEEKGISSKSQGISYVERFLWTFSKNSFVPGANPSPYIAPAGVEPQTDLEDFLFNLAFRCKRYHVDVYWI
jgi:hypothetical protein